MAVKKTGLGRGLGALLGQAPARNEPTFVPAPTDDLAKIPLDLLERGRYQPRMDMRPETLEELAQSIKAQGVMQPIVVRPLTSSKYEIIAGERRWRAARRAGGHSLLTRCSPAQ